jgi:hypothetical protein
VLEVRLKDGGCQPSSYGDVQNASPRLQCRPQSVDTPGLTASNRSALHRGLDKNANRLFVTCALVNLFLVRKRLLFSGSRIDAAVCHLRLLSLLGNFRLRLSYHLVNGKWGQVRSYLLLQPCRCHLAFIWESSEINIRDRLYPKLAFYFCYPCPDTRVVPSIYSE